MKILTIILALLAVPFIIGLFQNKKFESTLKHELKDEAISILTNKQVENPVLTMDKVDATIQGIVASQDERNNIGNNIDDIDGLRLKDSNNHLKVYGYLQAVKSGNTILLSGDVADEVNSLSYFNNLTNLSVSKSENLHGDSVFIDSPIANTPEFKAWTEEYFSAAESREFTLKGSDLTLTGEVTPRLKDQFISSAQALSTADLKVNVISDFKIVQPTAASIDITRTADTSSVTAKLPEGYDIEGLNLEKFDNKEFQYHPFTEGHPSINDPKFGSFVSSFFAPKGARALSLKGNEITLTGSATKPLLDKWLAATKGLGLKTKNGMKTYPSAFHFPAYKTDSKLTAIQLSELKSDLASSEIYFESGSSEVAESQIVKIELAASAIQNAGNTAQYVIGGHADATGDIAKNQALSLLRAQAVLNKLGEKGVDTNLLELVSFGAAKASTDEASASDRRVEILIK